MHRGAKQSSSLLLVKMQDSADLYQISRNVQLCSFPCVSYLIKIGTIKKIVDLEGHKYTQY